MDEGRKNCVTTLSKYEEVLEDMTDKKVKYGNCGNGDIVKNIIEICE